MKKTIYILCIVLGILIPVGIIVWFTLIGIADVWNSWGLQTNLENGETFWVYPGWEYLLLIAFKFSIYFIPPVFFAFSASMKNKKKIRSKRIYLYYFLNWLNIWFLLLLVIKLAAESIFELDRIFGFTIFNSIKDVQTLIGYILTFILQRKIKIEPDSSFGS